MVDCSTYQAYEHYKKAMYICCFSTKKATLLLTSLTSALVVKGLKFSEIIFGYTLQNSNY